MEAGIEVRNNSATNTLTGVADRFTTESTMRVADILRALEQQIEEDFSRLKAALDEQNELRPKVIRYRDLDRDVDTRKLRVRRIQATLGTRRFEALSRSLKDGKDVSNEIGVPTADDLPLWELMTVIVEQKPGIEVSELQLALEHFGRKASRQALESAFDSHRDVFEVETRGREKTVSLKGAA